MSGGHRAASRPVISGLKSTRWLITGLALVALAVVLLAAPLALAMYLIRFGTDLEIWGVAWLVAVAVLIQAVVRRKQGEAYLRWLMPGWLLAATWNVFSAFAHQRKWPPGQLHTLTLVGYGVAMVSAALFCVALVIAIRSSSFGRRWRRHQPIDSDSSH
jgi:hypothetical protein